MVKVFYPSKTNAVLGGQIFRNGVCTFEDNEAGIRFAGILRLKYEVEDHEVEEEIKPAKKPSKKRVKVDE